MLMLSPGAGLKIHFDLGVDYENFDSCDDLFADVTLLGEGAECKWQSPRDLFVLTGKGENLVEIGKVVGNFYVYNPCVRSLSLLMC